MKKIIFRSLVVCVCVLAFSFAANAQKVSNVAKQNVEQSGSAVMKDTGNAAVVLVGSAAKATWWTTKFAAKHFAKPLVVKMAPQAAKFAWKQLLPLAVKLSIM